MEISYIETEVSENKTRESRISYNSLFFLYTIISDEVLLEVFEEAS